MAGSVGSINDDSSPSVCPSGWLPCLLACLLACSPAIAHLLGDLIFDRAHKSEAASPATVASSTGAGDVFCVLGESGDNRAMPTGLWALGEPRFVVVYIVNPALGACVMRYGRG